MSEPPLRVREASEEEAETTPDGHQGSQRDQQNRLRGQVLFEYKNSCVRSYEIHTFERSVQVSERVQFRLPIGNVRHRLEKLFPQSFHQEDSPRAPRGRPEFRLSGEHLSQRYVSYTSDNFTWDFGYSSE